MNSVPRHNNSSFDVFISSHLSKWCNCVLNHILCPLWFTSRHLHVFCGPKPASRQCTWTLAPGNVHLCCSCSFLRLKFLAKQTHPCLVSFHSRLSEKLSRDVLIWVKPNPGARPRLMPMTNMLVEKVIGVIVVKNVLDMVSQY